MPDEYAFGLLTYDQLFEAWEHIRPLLDKAAQHTNGEMEVDDVLPSADNGNLAVFVMLHKGKIVLALAVEIQSHAHKTILNIVLAGGTHFRQWHDLFSEKVLQFGRECGATYVTARCRPSAMRLFNRICGTQPIYQVIGKEI